MKYQWVSRGKFSVGIIAGGFELAEFEVCKLALLNLHGVKMRRLISGQAATYKKVCEIILKEMKL